MTYSDSAHGPAGVQPGPRSGRIVLAVIGALLALVAFGTGVAGGVLVLAHATQRDDAGYYTTGTERLETLATLVRMYIGDELDWDVRLTLKPEERRQLALRRGSRIGYDTWLGGKLEAGVGTEELIVDPPELHDKTG